MKASMLQAGAVVAACDAAPEVNEKDEPPGQGLLSETVIKPDVSGFLQDAMVISEHAHHFLRQQFPAFSVKDWNNWKWQIKHSFTRLSQLAGFLDIREEEIGYLPGINDSLPMRITPYYASLMALPEGGSAIRRTMVPVSNEYFAGRGESSDPLSEGHDSPVPNLVHRYPDRVLFLVTGFCASYCRYCTRSHMVAKDKCHVGRDVWLPAIDYIRSHPEIRDVIISGGDPLTMPDAHLAYLLSALRAINHVEIIRIGTKVPVVMPQRITRNLLTLLKRYHPLYMSIHFSHPAELTPEVRMACNLLANAGIPLGSQTVLLKGINDDVHVMRKLMQGLLTCRVRPYYLYQCDPILGSAHFRTPVSKGLEIIEGLRGHTSGYAVPHYVIDAPGGGGKIPVLPDYYQGKSGYHIKLRNFEHKMFYYPDVD